MATKSSDFMSFNDGIAQIYAVANTAPPGDKPVEGLQLICKMRYCEKTVGLNRFFEALQAQVKITRLISIPFSHNIAISTQNVVVINGEQYKIVQAQLRKDTLPPTEQLSLAVIEEVYELPETEEQNA